MTASSSSDEIPLSPVTRATAIGAMCGVVLVGLYASQFERIVSGSWWLIPLPGIVAGGLGAVLNRYSLPPDVSGEIVTRSHRRLVTAAVTPLVVLAGIGVIVVGWGLANFDSLAGDLWAGGGGSSILVVDLLGFILLLLAFVVVLVALLVVLAVIGVAGAATTALAYVLVWRVLVRGDGLRRAGSTESPPD